jgi:hypothetical protein
MADRRTLLRNVLGLVQLTTSPNRTTDALILRAVDPTLAAAIATTDNDEIIPGWLAGTPNMQPIQAPKFTHNAGLILEWLPAGWTWTCGTEQPNGHHLPQRAYGLAVVERWIGAKRHNTIRRTSYSPALAMCLAVLCAISHEESLHG